MDELNSAAEDLESEADVYMDSATNFDVPTPVGKLGSIAGHLVDALDIAYKDKQDINRAAAKWCGRNKPRAKKHKVRKSRRSKR